MNTDEIEKQLNEIIRLLGLILLEGKHGNKVADEMMKMMKGLGN